MREHSYPPLFSVGSIVEINNPRRRTDGCRALVLNVTRARSVWEVPSYRYQLRLLQTKSRPWVHEDELCEAELSELEQLAWLSQLEEP